MSIEVKVPALPESVSEATVVTWHKQPGDMVKQDENLMDLETDKIVLEVPSPASGVLGEILKQQGATVKAGEVLARIDTSKEARMNVTKTKDAAKSVSASENKASTSTSTATTSQSTAARSTQATGPAARRKHHLGEEAIAHETTTEKPAVVNQWVDLSQTSTPSGLSVQKTVERLEKRVPMTRLRARIAERLVAAQHTAAILTTFNEVNLQQVTELRKKYKESFEKKYQTRLGFMSFFTKAALEALKCFPAVNASIDGNDVVYHNYFDIGIAVSTERGLVVPIVRDADRLSFAEIEKTIANFGHKAKENKLAIEDMTGGTFTITNGGVFGSLFATPIINPPQSAILGMNKIVERPVVENGQIVIRPMMYIALSYDHRIIDGKESVSFLKAIKEFLEDPTRLLLDV